MFRKKAVTAVLVAATLIMGGAVGLRANAAGNVADLILEQTISTTDSSRLNLYWHEDDDYNKYYKVYQTRDLVTWWPAILSEGAYNQVPQMTTTFGCTLSSVPWTAPATGEYRLVVNGAAGGNAGNQARGGRSEGTMHLEAGDVLYVCVGEAGNMAPRRQGGASGGGGYNGGGNGTGYEASAGFGGGGATHIAYKNNRGELYNYSSNRDEVLIVAGGGGGSDDQGQHSYPVREDGAGGAGGGFIAGTNGQRGTSDMAYWRDGSRQAWYGAGFGRGNSASCSEDSGGGGGGWVGGATSNYHEGGGAGGTGYINESMLYDYASYSNQNSGHGNASISLLDSSQLENYMNNVKIWDMAAPDKPYNISIDGKTDLNGNSTMIVRWDRPKDNGTDYWHKVESYNADTDELLNVSENLKSSITSGVKGYHYYIDSNSTGTVTKDNEFTSIEEIEISLDDQLKWVHIASVDNVGNLGETVHYQIPQAAVINYVGNDNAVNAYGDTTTTHVEGHINSQVVVNGGSSITIKDNVNNPTLGDTQYTREGYIFVGWNIEDAKIGGSAIGLNGLGYTGEFIPIGKEMSYIDLASKYGQIVNLYAVWEPIRYKFRLHGNNNWNTDEVGEVYEQEFRFDHPQKIDPVKFKRDDKWKFHGWGYTPEQTNPDFQDQEVILNLTSENNKIIELYALWIKHIVLTIDLNGGQYNNNSGPFKLEGDIYNNCHEYPFNIVGGGVSASEGKWSAQIGKMDIWGNVIQNGLNQNFTKIDSRGQIYRLLGWSTNKNAKVPDNKFIMYDSNRSKRYKIGDNTTLYAIWEDILQINMELTRTLGTLAFSDETDEQALARERCYNITNVNPGKVSTILRPTEQGRYKFDITSNIKNVVVKFSDDLIGFYEIYENDGLNPVNDEAKAYDENSITGLNRLITNSFNSWRAFYIPTYIDKIGKSTIDVDFTFTKESFYYDYVYGIDETAKINGKVYLYTSSGDSGGGTGGDEDIPISDSVIRDLRTRIRIE